MKKKLKIKNIITGVSLFLFIVITILLLTGKMDNIDLTIQSIIIGIRNNNLNETMKTITNICSFYAIVALTLLLLIIIKNKNIPLSIMLNLICISLLNLVFKFIIQRQRPEGINIINVDGYSYPSGHSMISMAFFGFIAYLIYKKLNNKIYKVLTIIISIIIVFLIGFSRIYLGVHYFSDVLGGFFASLGYLIIFTDYYQIILKEIKKII